MQRQQVDRQEANLQEVSAKQLSFRNKAPAAEKLKTSESHNIKFQKV